MGSGKPVWPNINSYVKQEYLKITVLRFLFYYSSVLLFSTKWTVLRLWLIGRIVLVRWNVFVRLPGWWDIPDWVRRPWRVVSSLACFYKACQWCWRFLCPDESCSRYPQCCLFRKMLHLGGSLKNSWWLPYIVYPFTSLSYCCKRWFGSRI